MKTQEFRLSITDTTGQFPLTEQAIYNILAEKLTNNYLMAVVEV